MTSDTELEIAKIDRDGAVALGDSPFARSFRVRHLFLNRPVVLRVLKNECGSVEGISALFANSCQALSSVASEHVASVIDRTADGCVLEYFDGENLDHLLHRTGSMDLHSALSLALRAARALRVFWEHGLVMVDFRAAAFLLSYDGDEPRLRIADALVAPLENGGVRLGVVIPAEPYFSPEQIAGQGIDARSNIFSLGVLLHQLLTGELPVGGVLLHRLRGLPHGLIDALSKMLEPAPENRFQTPAEVILALETWKTPSERNPVRLAIPSAGDVPLASERRFKEIEALDVEQKYFLAYDQQGNGRVLLHRLATPISNQERAEMDAAVILRAYPDKNAIAPLYVGDREGDSYVVYEWLHGFCLLDVIQKRQRLTLEESLDVLEAVAGAVDHAILRGIRGLDCSISGVRFHFDSLMSREQLLQLAGTAPAGWPAFAVKVPVVGASRGFQGGHRTASENLEPDELVKAFGALAREVLGGRQTSGNFAPIAGLSEQANAVLARTVQAAAKGKIGAREIVSELRLAASETRKGDGALRQAGPYAGTHSRFTNQPKPVREKSEKQGSRVVMIAIAVVLVLAGVGFGVPESRQWIVDEFLRLAKTIPGAEALNLPEPVR